MDGQIIPSVCSALIGRHREETGEDSAQAYDP